MYKINLKHPIKASSIIPGFNRSIDYITIRQATFADIIKVESQHMSSIEKIMEYAHILNGENLRPKDLAALMGEDTHILCQTVSMAIGGK